MSVLNSIEEWFRSQCNGDWEHGEGIKISTLDNPGWAVDIDLTGTVLENKPYEAIRIERDGNDWLWCFTKYNKFIIRCGPKNLEQGLKTFLQWAVKTH